MPYRVSPKTWNLKFYCCRLDHRKYTSGFCLFLKPQPGAVSWGLKLQAEGGTATSDTEAISLYTRNKIAAARTSKWGRKRHRKSIKIPISCNNKKNRELKKSEIFAIKFSFIHLKIEMRRLDVDFCPTNELTFNSLTSCQTLLCEPSATDSSE